MTDDLVARPGDSDLDCHLTGLRLTAVDEMPPGEYAAEAMLTFSTMDAGGWYAGPSEGANPGNPYYRPSRWADGKDIQISFGIRAATHVAAARMAVLHAWCERGAYVEMTCAPGKQTLLRCKGESVVLPRSETAVAR